MKNYSDLYHQSISNREEFWKEQASLLPWSTFPQTILERKNQYHYDWFSDGKLNMSYMCIDTHIEKGRGDQIAIIYDSPATGIVEKITYQKLYNEVSKLAGAMSANGLKKGDCCIIYMPMIPQAVYAMLACARLGVVHSVVFGGFAPHELAIRIDDARPKMIISANYGIEFDKKIEYKPLLDKSIEECQYKPKLCLIYQRNGEKAHLIKGRDFEYQEMVQNAPKAAPVIVDSGHPLYILYTSGTTGKPKGIVRDTGGYATALHFSMKNIYNVEKGDVFWAASDVGWVVGHSYIVYGPLLAGCTSVLFEGKPIRTPDAGTFWRVCAEHGVKTMFTAPTAIRAIKKEDPEALLMQQYDLSQLNCLFLAGERCDPATFYWAKEKLQKPVIDHWWQTESGWPMLGIQMGNPDSKEAKAGSSNFPICGFEIDILDEKGQKLPENEEGLVCVKLPMPPGCLTTLWKNDEGFINSYLSKFNGYYLSGDGGYIDSDGYYFIMGRIDDVINVAGHRLSTGEMEEILASHPSIAECAVVGISDQLRGQRPIGFVVLKDNAELTEERIEADTIALIRSHIGAVAYYKNTILVNRLPKTRSGKILRKSIRMLADDVPFVTPSTIDDPAILNELYTALQNRQIGKKWEEN